VATYPCPVCRKAHPLNLDKLQVDQALTNFIAKLKLRQTTSSVTVQLQAPAGSATKAVPLVSETILEPVPMPAIAEEEAAPAPKAAERATEAQVEAEESITCPGAPYLPPQSGDMKGRLTVVLDLDGTLISSFTPRRAPSLAPGSTSYVCGRGAKLNPNGVLVVERPDLGAFLKRLSEFAEVVLFTAGLEDYAAPICDALEKRYGAFTAKLFRPATVHSEVYPCVKDLSLLGRDLARIVLIDDTPLAFLNQPDNGIPIYNFRGDIDDRVLPEAILPLLDQLAAVDDVRPLLHRRFDMPRWLASHGLAPSKTAKTAASPVKRRLRLVPGKPEPEKEREKISDTLILSDFDQTLTDCDAGERLVGELAPELVPMLAALQQPANFVPLTNAVLSEMARRGISEEVLNATLQKMGSEIPSASLKMLQWAAQQTVDFRLISDCNSLFISQILTGARVNLLVKEVITNRSAFERTAAHDSAVDLTRLDACTGSSGQLHPGECTPPGDRAPPHGGPPWLLHLPGQPVQGQGGEGAEEACRLQAHHLPGGWSQRPVPRPQPPLWRHCPGPQRVSAGKVVDQDSGE
jgi:RNA polymerase II subunit A small phosphatase-like protein